MIEIKVNVYKKLIAVKIESTFIENFKKYIYHLFYTLSYIKVFNLLYYICMYPYSVQNEFQKQFPIFRDFLTEMKKKNHQKQRKLKRTLA